MVRRMPFVALALPGTLLAGVLTIHMVMALGAAHPMWREQPVNISEAAALHDAATVLRLMRQGATATDRHLVRAGLLFDRAVALTPLEAAIAAGRGEVVDVVLAASMPVEWNTWQHAKCLAAGDQEVDGVVDAYRPVESAEPGRHLDCADVEKPWP